MKHYLSNNFCVEEFTKIPQVDTVEYMMKHLAVSILEPLRHYLECPIFINSGVRNLKDFHRLIDQGYHPSENSDHFYGEYSRHTVGAVDIWPFCGADVAWKGIKSLFSGDLIRLPETSVQIGQCIYEERGDSKWIHISNPKSIVYNSYFTKEHLTQKHFLESFDGGKTYSEI